MIERERGLLQCCSFPPLSPTVSQFIIVYGEKLNEDSFRYFLPVSTSLFSLSPLLWLFVAPASACGGEPSGERPSLSIPPPSRFPYPHSAIPQPKPTVLEWGEEEGDSAAGCRLPQVSAGACTVSFFLVLPM